MTQNTKNQTIQVRKIQSLLKDLLKDRGHTYLSLAKILGISTVTIKRRLNGDDLSLNQIEEIAQVLEMSFYELIELSKKETRQPTEFNEEQELFLAEELIHIQIIRHVILGLTFKELTERLKISEFKLRKIMKRFENVRLLKLMAKDRIQLLVPFPFTWKPEGPLSRTYDRYVLQQITERAKAKGKKSILYRPFELALSQDMVKNFSDELLAVFIKYRDISRIRLEEKNKTEDLVSGLIFIDDFSIW